METQTIFTMEPDKLVVENAQIIFRNFSGNEDKFRQSGTRSFGLILDNELAEKLAEDGWNIKYLKPRSSKYMFLINNVLILLNILIIVLYRKLPINGICITNFFILFLLFR